MIAALIAGVTEVAGLAILAAALLILPCIKRLNIDVLDDRPRKETP